MPLATHLGTWNIGTVKNTIGSKAGTIQNMGTALVAQSFSITDTMNNAGYIPTNIVLPVGAFIVNTIFDVFQEARGSQCPGGNTFPQLTVYNTLNGNLGANIIADTGSFITTSGSDYILPGNTRYVINQNGPVNNNNWSDRPPNYGNPNIYILPTDRIVYFIESTDNTGMTGKVTVIYGIRNNIYNAS